MKNVLRACGSGLAVGFLHVLLLILIWFGYFFGSLIGGMILFSATGDALFANRTAPLVVAGLVYLGYVFVWYMIWLLQFENGKISFFYSKLGFALVPLVVALALYQPVDPAQATMAILDVPDELIRSSLLTALVLLPLYSIGLVRFVLPKTKKTSIS
ncbi:hypothetical protein JJB07_09035 [Tumebacillus sp. ITR2]|uniref:Uncharacterized protein n=1 Tax=Tumebacillus amylolyticus TaxID=2801339 RepID=A0ABS1J944_9BACL|nr:hypothetical protein [Tumebacillus amylolyticus]MBL0386796.1 hypothetical protein [Tumebacillus amylolyticus]